MNTAEYQPKHMAKTPYIPKHMAGVPYRPKHLKRYDDGDHRCLHSCSPMRCERGCCVRAGSHKASCPSNVYQIYDQHLHDRYVRNGKRRHLYKPLDCGICNGTGLSYDRTECRMVPCGGICCVVKS